jgi:F-type H+-transporting ATPase subunit b
MIGLALSLIVMLAPEVLAAEGGGGFRPTWDLIMRWVNFLILVAVIVKFARRPLKDFIDGKRDEVAFELKQLEEKKEAARADVNEIYRELEKSQERFEQIKVRIIKQSEARKEEIIEQARNESRVILDSTRRKIDFKLLEARKKLRSELVDSAVDMALEKLPQHITAEDNQKLLEQYINRIS